jgi:uncharacterized membrane protein YfcA
MITLALVLAVLIGVSLGLLGGGGSILTVPILVYVVGLEPRDGIATSLLVVGVTSAVAMLSHARAGRVQFARGCSSAWRRWPAPTPEEGSRTSCLRRLFSLRSPR